MDAVAFVAAAAAFVVAGGFGAAALGLRSPVSFALAAYLIASASVVAVTQLLSVGRLVDAWSYGAASAGVLAAALVAWNARGRERPPFPHLDLAAGIRTHPLLAALALAVTAAAAYELFLVLATPPNTGDSLTYHLTRAAAWLQHGGVYRIPGGSAPENDYPANAEIEILFTFAFLHNDRAAALPQLVASGVAMVAVYGLARRLGFGRAESLFPALLAPTLSQLALQSVSTQNDLLVGALVVVGAYFLHARERPDVWLAGLAIGLALGTKLTAVFALPALGAIAVASLRGRALATAALAAVVGFAIVGSQSYVRNLADSHSLIGTRAGDVGLQQPDVTVAGTVSTVARYAYGLADFSGYPLDYRDLRLPTAALRKAFTAAGIEQNPPESTGYPFGFALNVRANEDVSFFGPLGFAIVLPLSIGAAFLALRRRVNAAVAAHALALPLYLLALSLGYRYSGQGRFLITPVLLTLPLAAVLYRRRVIAAVAVAIGVASLAFAHAHSETKPTGLRGTTPAWSLSRADAQGLQAAAEVDDLIERIEAQVPEDARIGVVVGEHDPDYVLYGPRLRRRLVPVPADSPIESARRQGLRWIYLGRFADVPTDLRGWNAERLSDAGTLLSRPRRLAS